MGNYYSVGLEEFLSVSARGFLYNLHKLPRTKLSSLNSLKQLLRCCLCPRQAQGNAKCFTPPSLHHWVTIQGHLHSLTKKQVPMGGEGAVFVPPGTGA